MYLTLYSLRHNLKFQDSPCGRGDDALLQVGLSVGRKPTDQSQTHSEPSQEQRKSPKLDAQRGQT